MAMAERVENVMICTFTEPDLADLLADPLVRIVMRSDGLTVSVVRDIMDQARRTLQKNRPVHPISDNPVNI